MKPVRAPIAAALLAALLAAPAAAQDRAATDSTARLEAAARYVLPPPEIREAFTRDPGFAALDAPSPDGRWFLVPRATELSTLERMSAETYRLAELELRPRTDRLWHLDTYGIIGLRFFGLQDRTFRDVALPAGAIASDMVWSPDGERIAFLAHLPSRTEVWTADAATGRTRRLADARIPATLGTSAQTAVRPSRMVQWTPEGTVLSLMVPAGRAAEPARSRVPAGPVVRHTRPEPTPTRTFPNLLRDGHDADLFEHYTTSQIVELAEGRRPRPIGGPAMWESIALSPDGRYILATRIERPFSFLTSHQGFPRRTVVLDRDGNELATLEARPLREAATRPGAGADATGRRAWAWRPDGAGLSFLEREAVARDGERADATTRRDRVMLLAPPFDTAATTVVAVSDDPIRDAVHTRDGRRVFATVTRGGRSGIAHWTTTAPAERRMLVDFHDPADVLDLPGELWTGTTPNGVAYARVSADGAAAYLRGDGFRADFRPRPFVDRVALADGARSRTFEGATDTFDQPLVPLDADLTRMIVSRESVSRVPDSYLWTRDDGRFENLTGNADPFPAITAARRIDFEFERRDGVKVQGRISLPVGYRDGTKVPAVFWTYPREYTRAEDYDRAAIRARNRNAFTPVTWLRWSDLWLTQGYALVHPDLPIIGENYNDTYIANLVDGMYASMRAVDALGYIDMDRIGHGGHSYGAFTTVNLLAHTPFFRAGIAGHGAYNRSLTPTGFQAESRDIWSAPHTYLEISPFFRADQIDTPLLLYHGGDDNNTGTWPMQSERLIHALTSLGKKAVLYVYPYESHTPRAIENNLDMWARWLDWFDTHVKGAAVRAATDGG